MPDQGFFEFVKNLYEEICTVPVYIFTQCKGSGQGSRKIS